MYKHTHIYKYVIFIHINIYQYSAIFIVVNNAKSERFMHKLCDNSKMFCIFNGIICIIVFLVTNKYDHNKHFSVCFRTVQNLL